MRELNTRQHEFLERELSNPKGWNPVETTVEIVSLSDPFFPSVERRRFLRKYLGGIALSVGYQRNVLDSLLVDDLAGMQGVSLEPDTYFPICFDSSFVSLSNTQASYVFYGVRDPKVDGLVARLNRVSTVPVFRKGI